MSQRNATRAFEAAVKRATLDGVTFHALRHTSASMLIGQGEDPVFVGPARYSKPAFAPNTYAHLFRAARHAREARRQLETEYGDLLRGASKGPSVVPAHTPHYWEAWAVDAASTVSPSVGAINDMWSRPDLGANTKGHWSMRGS